MPPTAGPGTTGLHPAGAEARAARRDRRRAGIALAIVLPALVAGGCGPESVLPPVAEVADGGPDCLAADVLWSLGLTPPQGYARPGTRPGAVPVDVEPVAVVQCLGPFDLPVTMAGPQPRQTLPTLAPSAADRVVPAPDAELPLVVGTPAPVEPPGTSAPGPVPDQPAATVVEAELRGDLGPLLAALARPSYRPAPDQPCPAIWQSQPVIFLVDAEGRAVRARWPTDACGFLLDGVTRPLDALEVVRETPRTAPDA